MFINVGRKLREPHPTLHRLPCCEVGESLCADRNERLLASPKVHLIQLWGCLLPAHLSPVALLLLCSCNQATREAHGFLSDSCQGRVLCSGHRHL